MYVEFISTRNSLFQAQVRWFDVFKKCLRKIFDEKRVERLPLEEVKADMDKIPGVKTFSEGEMTAALERMSDENNVMVSDDVIYLI
uniref:MCM3-like winged helix domain-containing protein n=1 Tax=Romanomermis culicivorax TaxID=13658 RepID=A0A915L8X4_ROMCU